MNKLWATINKLKLTLSGVQKEGINKLLTEKQTFDPSKTQVIFTFSNHLIHQTD